MGVTGSMESIGASWATGSGGQRCQRRFEPLELASGHVVVDLVAEAATAPRCRWNRETADFVADALVQTPGYAAHFTWVSITDDGDEPHLLAAVRLSLENERLRAALRAIAKQPCPDTGCASGPTDSSHTSIAVAALERSR